jgi:hypothetical protein
MNCMAERTATRTEHANSATPVGRMWTARLLTRILPATWIQARLEARGPAPREMDSSF